MADRPVSESPSPFRAALQAMIDRAPERHPLVLGLVAPLGTKTTQVSRGIEAAAARFGYGFQTIQLSSLLDDIDNAPWDPLPKRTQPGYYEQRQSAGNRLRQDAGSSSLAALAVFEVGKRRKNLPPDTIFLLNSLKHPDEAKLLEHIYGDAFWLVAVVTDPDVRRDNLAEQLANAEANFEDPRAEAEKLIRRDEDEESVSSGQHVRDVSEHADVYVPMARGHDIDDAIGRFFEGVFARPFHTPTADEEAMCLAFEASLRSASMGRQVGAVLKPVTGATYVVGTNEVPKPGGGQYWSGDVPDHRDFSLDDDPNPVFISRMLQELLHRMNERNWLAPSMKDRTSDELLRLANEQDAFGKTLLSGTRANAVIEFTRCLHAEQAAIANAARQGITTQGATLYTTTFPCHECAKFIVGAGVVLVIYIEPYPKSLVRQLYRDLIDMRATLNDPRDASGLLAGKVAFSPFVGFSPKRYDLIFTAPERRVGTSPKRFVPSQALPRGQAWIENAVVEKEASAAKAISGLLIELYTPAATAEAETKTRDQSTAPDTEQRQSGADKTA